MLNKEREHKVRRLTHPDIERAETRLQASNENMQTNTDM